MALLRWVMMSVLLSLLQLCTSQPPLEVDDLASGSAPGTCPEGDYRCPVGGACLPVSVLCNGVEDCPEGGDELLCIDPSIAGCRPDQISCGLKTCLSRAVLCDGVEDCLMGLDERNCPPPSPGSNCAGNQFECLSSGECIPLARQCDGTEDCQNAEDEMTCEFPEISSVNPPQVMVDSGENITLTCVVEGNPPPFITWRKDLLPLRPDRRYEVRSEGGIGTLSIFGARTLDVGEFSCQVVSAQYGTQLALRSIAVNVTDATPFLCQDHTGTQFPEGVTYYMLRTFTTGPATEAAADVIFVVDESGSMAMEHEWIRTEVVLLNDQLRERGIGLGSRQNLFALVGFGRNNREDILGIVLSQLTTPEQFINASNQLELTGVSEDGYAGIDFALDNIVSRMGTAKLMIFVTDEDRSIIRLDLSRAVIEQRLREEGFLLNVVVNQGFLSDPQDSTSHALGLDSNGTAYTFDRNNPNLFSSQEGGTYNQNPLFGFEDTYRDYVELAFATGGVAWDLNQLREQGLYAQAFTNAFTQVKVDEVMNVSRVCFSCFCTPPDSQCALEGGVGVEECSGEVPVLSVAVTPVSTLVLPGTMVTFQCMARTNDPMANLQFSWRYPQQLPGAVVVVGNTLTVIAADPSSAGVYICTVNNSRTGAVASANGTLSIDARRCVLEDGRTIQPGDSIVVITSPLTNLSRAADVILIVDESGSMVMEHAWIENMTQRLDEALMGVNIGVNPLNRFGVVGFGSDCGLEDILLGRVVTNSDNQVFTAADGIGEFTLSLNTSGRREDGYSGIMTALDSYTFRDVARQFILITDEDRDEVRQELSREGIQALLVDARTLLNVAISEEFMGNDLRALGIDSNWNAYVYDPSASSLFRIIRGVGVSVADSAHGSTNSDYTQLALEIGGGAWDLSQLRTGGTVAEAFTNAFVHVKVVEIRSQMEQCLNCSCSLSGTLVCEPLPPANFSECVSSPDPPADESPISISVEPETATLTPGGQQTFECEANNSATLRWTYNGGLLPENALAVTTSNSSSALTIMMATARNSGVYACLGHSPSEAFSDAAVVTVDFYDQSQDLMLELFPLSHRIATGDSTNFTCQVPSPASFTWSFEDGPIPRNAMVEGSDTESVLTLTAALGNNTGEYTCTVNNTDIGVVNEDTAYLEVTPVVLRLSVRPRSTTVLEGTAAVYSCSVNCYPGENSTCPMFPQWSREDGDALPPQAMVVTSTEMVGAQQMVQAVVTIPVTRMADGGRYKCTAGEDRRNITEPTEAMTILCITPAFRAMIPGPPMITIQQGQNSFLRCESSENATRFSWTFNGLPVRVQGSSMITDEDPNMLMPSVSLGDGGLLAPDNVVVVPDVSSLRSVLAILEPTEENTGTYECRAESEIGDMALVSVEVVVAFPTTTTTPITLPPPITLLASPSLTVAISPVVLPSPLPTDIPSPLPTDIPSPLPTGIPSPVPTDIPSPLPTSIPSRLPTSIPSPLPTDIPSPLPTDVLSSMVPTATPPPLPPFSVSISFRTLELAEGMNGTIRCQINHPSGSFEWRLDFGSLPNNVRTSRPYPDTSDLTIYNMTQQSTGQYQCTARSDATGEQRTVFTTVIFIEMLAIIVSPQGSVTVNETRRVELICYLDCGCSGTILDWSTQSGRPLPPSAMVSRTAGGRTISLVFEQATADVEGLYACTATNARLGNVTEVVRVNVITTPPIGDISVVVSPSSVTLPEMSDFLYNCLAGSPAVSFEWRFNLAELPVNAVPRDVSSVTSQLFIQNVTLINAGNYFCTATYANGGMETGFANLIFADPSPTASPDERAVSIVPMTITLPQMADFIYTCVANSPVQSFSWRFNLIEDLPGNAQPRNLSSTVSQLEIRNVSQPNAGAYYCIATFSDGTERRNFTHMIFQEPLRIAVTPGPEVEVSMDTQVEFSCSLVCACSGNITLTWTRPGAALPLSAIITRIDPRRVTLNFRATAQEAGLYRCTASRSRTVPAVEEVRLVVQ